MPPQAPHDVGVLTGWRRHSTLAMLILLCSWFGASLADSGGSVRIGFKTAAPSLWWMGAWDMFTSGRDRHRVMEATAHLGEPGRSAEREVDLAALFPTRWSRALRMERPGFRLIPEWAATLGHATCLREAEAHPEQPPPAFITLWDVRWDKTLGQQAQPRGEDLTRERLLTWDCSREPPLPGGVVW